jgi:hypothetical protein
MQQLNKPTCAAQVSMFLFPVGFGNQVAARVSARGGSKAPDMKEISQLAL